MFFINEKSLAGTWQNFERMVCRFLLYRGFDGVRVVGASGDKGADIVGHFCGKRWVFQVKRWKKPVGAEQVNEITRALRFYGADVPALVSLSGFEQSAYERRRKLAEQNVLCQLWDGRWLLQEAEKMSGLGYPPGADVEHQTRQYQEDAIRRLLGEFHQQRSGRGMVVMATGLGKTRVMCEFIRRANAAHDGRLKVMAVAHTNDLILQLERAFWPFLLASQQTVVWNGLEPQNFDGLCEADCVFACINTAANYLERSGELPDFDIVFVDECHHVGGSGMYPDLLESLSAGRPGGAFLAGTTATPWRQDEYDLARTFGDPLITIDLVAGLRNGFLSAVDYRMYTTNLDWQKIASGLRGKKKAAPRGINRTLFVIEWDDGVVNEIEKAWREQVKPRAIVFCGSIYHAQMMRDKLNARQFCRAESVFSGSGKEQQAIHNRNRIISDFQIGKVDVICCVDIFNEGIDVPDVNIVVFQRVTHSRRIFVQQLGRGLRIAPGKEKVIVLDFVSDVRRFAAGIQLKDAIAGTPIRLNHKVEFRRYGETDDRAESFLREWLQDIATVETMGENAAELRYPPPLSE